MEKIKTPNENTITVANSSMFNNVGGITTTGTMNSNSYGKPELLDTILQDDSIILVYQEHPQYWLSYSKPDRRVFKIIS